MKRTWVWVGAAGVMAAAGFLGGCENQEDAKLGLGFVQASVAVAGRESAQFERRAAAPATQPAPPPAGPKVPTPWNGARVGDRLTFRHMNDASRTMVMEVIAVDDENVTVKVTVALEGQPLPSMQDKFPRRAFPTPAPAGQETKDLGTEVVVVGARQLTCKVTQITLTAPGRPPIVSKAWTCPDVPGEVVKMQSDGKTVMELIEFRR